MKRTLPLLVVLVLGGVAVACKDDSSNKPKQAGATPGGEQPGGDNGENPGGGPGNPPTAEEMSTNPTDGLQPATAVLEAGAFTDGPVWHAGMGVLFFSTPLGDGALFRALPDGRVLKVRDGVLKDGTQPIGNTVNPAGEIVTVEAKRIVRSPAAGGDAILIADKYTGADAPPPDPLNPDAGAPQIQAGAFDTLNDVVSRKDGTLYVTDPGFFAEAQANRIYRITPDGKTVQVVEAFDDVPRPNGLVLSPDEKTLYVGFTQPVAGTLPFIRKYIVNDDGTLGEWTKFVDVGPEESNLDGLATDKVGNVYAATKAGIQVYKPDGSPWGTIAVPEPPTGMTFGGADLKTLYITTTGTKVWQVQAKLSGLSQ